MGKRRNRFIQYVSLAQKNSGILLLSCYMRDVYAKYPLKIKMQIESEA